ncbi:probable disease resistance protein At1g61300 [Setaria viridis]
MAASATLVFAGKSVATPAISFLINKAFTYLNKYRNAEGVAEMKDRILGRLDQIQAVFDVFNPERIKGESRALDAWLWKLRDAVEKAEDALDDVEYYELEKKAKDRKVSNWGSTFDKIKHNAMKYVKETTIVDKATKGLTHGGSLKRLRKSLEGLDKAAAGVADFVTLAECLRGSISQLEEDFLKDRETGSNLTAPEVFGQNKEKELLIGWLTKPSCEDAEIKVCSNHVSIVSIVGHGGMGKTTLAQFVCQDDAVRKHFEMVIWACISTGFDAMSATSKILESATWATPNAKTLEALQKILEENLKSVKFLLILDDVWDDKKTDQWEKLFAPLRAGKSGSRILLTTRMQSVADLAAYALASKNECLALQGLEEDENIKLFHCHAFPKESLQHYAALQPISGQIAKNLRGCPLMTKVAASHLRDNLSFQYWNNFLHQRLEHFGGTAEDIMNVLKLSYWHLPIEMQTCFRYCSIFPQDFVFDKEQLVKMWVSSGLISQVAFGSESLMNTGKQYLDQLTQPENHSFFFERNGKNDNFGNEKYIMHDLMHDLAKYVSLGECARAVDVASLENVASTVRHICIEHINNLSAEKIIKITHLENLRTIIIKGMKPINEVTLNIVEELVQSSKSLRLLQTNLWQTSHFVGKLAILKHLRFVGLQWIPPESICGVIKLYHLTTLECRYMRIEQEQLRDVANIEAQVNLMKLSISNFSGIIVSLWAEKLVVQNLVKLELQGLGSCEQLLAIEKLLTLEDLMLVNIPRLEKIGQGFDVSGYECTELFLPPNLHNLVIRNCPKLKELPLLPPSLKSLYIKEVGLTKLPGVGKVNNRSSETASFRWLSIVVQSCQSLTSLEGSLFEQKQHMEAVTYLRITDCVQLESAPLPFEEMKQLSRLDISCCPKLRTLRGSEDKLLTSSLRRLTIGQCGELEGSLQGIPLPDTLKSWVNVSIVECESLSSLGGLESLPLVRSLEITGCCKLTEAGLSLNLDVSGGGEEHLVVPRSSLRIQKLRIDHPSLLLVEPLNSLCQTNKVILDGSEMESVPEGWLLQNRSSLKSLSVIAKSLESLPSSMQDLSSLEKLCLTSAGKLRSLPDLPSSLKKIYLSRCNLELEKNLREFGSLEQTKICHVLRVEIGDSYFIMGKQCNKETFEKLRYKDNNTLSSWANQQEDSGKCVE